MIMRCVSSGTHLCTGHEHSLTGFLPTVGSLSTPLGLSAPGLFIHERSSEMQVNGNTDADFERMCEPAPGLLACCSQLHMWCCLPAVRVLVTKGINTAVMADQCQG
jgi:hypothetical protein